jgi:chemotaxis protein histidine kinase CheA
MNSLKKDFIERTRVRLNDLSARISASEPSPEFLRETARALHTIKGTSQTFGFSASSKLAHELENLLTTRENLETLLPEGFAALAKSFDEENIDDFVEKISQTKVATAFDFSKIPTEISDRLSDFERKAFASALADGKKIFQVNASFDLENFHDEFKKLREDLSAKGEIIATLPAPQIEKNKIGFMICFAGDDTENIFSQLEAHAANLARDSGKEINITIFADKIELSRNRSNLVFDVLLHLVRNAVDHGIETPDERTAKNKTAAGTIAIVLKRDEKGMNISVADDGKGIDTEKLRAKALGKNLFSNETDLTAGELLDLIFLHDFSTAETVTETSGRGVGLDVVKALAENAGGKIGVKSVENLGTTFEIFLPAEN